MNANGTLDYLKCSCGGMVKEGHEEACSCCGTMLCDFCYYNCDTCKEPVCGRCIEGNWSCTFCNSDRKSVGQIYMVIDGEKAEIENGRELLAYVNQNPLGKIEVNLANVAIVDYKYKTVIYNYKTKKYDYFFMFEERSYLA